MAQRILLRRGTSSQWSFYNPVLNAGEPGFDTSNQVLKIGDGTTAWNDLDSYSAGAGGGGSTTNNYYTTFESGVYITGDQLISGEKRFDSFISGNVSGNLSGNAQTVTSGVYRTGDQTIGGSKDFVGDLLISGSNIETLINQGGTYGDSNVATYLNGNLDAHIIPDTNSTYDIGSAEYKIRHLYLSNNSLYIGDDTQTTPEEMQQYNGEWFAGRASSEDVELVNTNKGSINDFNTAFNGASTANARILSTYSKADLPQAAMAGARTVVEDGGIDGSPVDAFFHKGVWRRSSDNSVISDKKIDVYLLAGQSNAHGHADISALDDSLKYQQGLFYSSWHHSTSNASSPQYYSEWSTVAEAGFTRGDPGESYLGGSENFGPELGFLYQAKQIDLANGRPIGILKHAIGASTLVDETSIVEHNGTNYICIQSNQNTNPNSTNGDYIATLPEPGTSGGNSYWEVTTETAESTWSSNGAYRSKGLSDWDLNDTGDKRGDALRAFKLAVQDGLNKLTAANYTYRIAGLIWWQGESGSSVSGLTDLIVHIRDWLDSNYTLDIPKENFPVTITKIGYGTDLTPVADQDAHIEIVDAGAFGHSGTNNHIGEAQNPDTTNSGVNDMFEIGQAYADAMAYAIPGRSWTPSLVQSKLHAWYDMSDPEIITEKTGGYVETISDKSDNNFDLTVETNSTVTAIHNGQNSLDFLRFDSGDHTVGRSLAVTSDYIKMFLLVKPTSGVANSTLLLWQGGGPQYIFFHGAPNDAVYGRYHGIGNSTNDNRLNKWTLFTLVIDKTAGTITTGANGVNFSEDVAISGTSTFSGSSFALHWYGNQAKADADWGEIVILNNPTAEEELKTEGYLAHKWGIANELNANHSYKQSAP